MLRKYERMCNTANEIGANNNQPTRAYELSEFRNTVTEGLKGTAFAKAYGNAELKSIFTTAAANDGDGNDSVYTASEANWQNLINQGKEFVMNMLGYSSSTQSTSETESADNAQKSSESESDSTIARMKQQIKELQVTNTQITYQNLINDESIKNYPELKDVLKDEFKVIEDSINNGEGLNNEELKTIARKMYIKEHQYLIPKYYSDDVSDNELEILGRMNPDSPSEYKDDVGYINNLYNRPTGINMQESLKKHNNENCR